MDFLHSAAADAGRGEPYGRGGPFPGATQVGGQRARRIWAWRAMISQVRRSATAGSRIFGVVQPRTWLNSRKVCSALLTHMKRPCQAFAGRRVVDHLMSVFRRCFCARFTRPARAGGSGGMGTCGRRWPPGCGGRPGPARSSCPRAAEASAARALRAPVSPAAGSRDLAAIQDMRPDRHAPAPPPKPPRTGQTRHDQAQNLQKLDQAASYEIWACGGDTVQVMRPPRRKSTQNTRGGYSEDTQIRA